MLKIRFFILISLYLGQISHVNGQWRPDGVHPDLIPNSQINTPEPNKNAYDERIASTTSGSILWNVGNSTGSSAVGSDASGKVYALGSYRGASNINGVQLPGYGGLDFVIFKFNPAGDLIWHITGCGSGDDYAYITTDQSSNTYLSGFSTAACTITGKNGTSYTANRSGGREGFLVKIGPEGQIKWGVSLAGGSATDAFNSVHVDELGNVFATASFNGCCGSTGSATVFFPGGSRVINSIGFATGALLKFDSGGTFKWSVRIGNRDVSIDKAVTDSNQNVYFTGVQRAWSSGTSGSMVDGTGASSTILNPGIGNSFLVKLDATGKRIFGLAIGNLGSGPDASTSITDLKIDGSNNLHLLGSYFGGEAVFNSTNSTVLRLPSSTTITGFLAQYSTNGTPQRVTNLNVSSSSNTWPQKLAWFQGKLYVAGAYRANTSNSGNYGFVSELNDEITMTETKTIIGSGSENAVGLTATDNQLFASGSYGNSSSFDGAVLSGSGSFLWQTQVNTSNRTVTDIDGKVYKTRLLGTQLWMESNLRVSRYNDGTPIPQIKLDNPTGWSTNNTGAWSYYNDDVNNNALFGKLYNFYVVSNVKNVCPTGWQVPSDEAWTQLNNFLGTDAGLRMKSTSGWRDSGNGTNESGFNAVPAGRKGSSGIAYTEIALAARFWSSTENNQNNGWIYRLTYDSDELQRAYNQKGNGFSIRCMLDPSSPVSIDEAESIVPNTIELQQNYPNPFNPTTQIRFALPESQQVTIQLYDVNGRLVAELLNNAMYSAGNHQVTFDGSGLSSGIYIYTMRTSSGMAFTRKLLLVK